VCPGSEFVSGQTSLRGGGSGGFVFAKFFMPALQFFLRFSALLNSGRSQAEQIMRTTSWTLLVTARFALATSIASAQNFTITLLKAVKRSVTLHCAPIRADGLSMSGSEVLR
jgi:hypothetical protein